MKPRYRELLDRAIEALSNAIEIYNKPNTQYREETFIMLIINAWELLLKAKWLFEHENKMQSLYINTAPAGKKPRYKKTKSGVKLTHEIGFLARKLSEKKMLDMKAVKNIEALVELRNAATHFYLNRRNPMLTEAILELGIAGIKNFFSATRDWFDHDLSKLRTPIIPISVDPIPDVAALQLNRDEKAFIQYFRVISAHDADPAAPYSVAVNVEMKYIRSNSAAALPIKITDDPTAPSFQLTEEQIKEQYPFDYKQLTRRCRERYKNFKVDKRYHELRKSVEEDRRYAYVRRLDPTKPKPRKVFYSGNIFAFLDQHYEREN